MVCRYADMVKDIVDDKFVIFTNTSDPESPEILKCLRGSRLEQFYYKLLDIVYTHEALDFLRNLEQIANGQLQSSVGGERFEILDADLIRIFGLQPGRNAPDEYRSTIDEKEFLQTVLLRLANKDQVVNVTNPLLRRKYRSLFEIVSKVILGFAFSPDALTQAKQRVMTAIIEKASDMNWLGMFKQKLLQETDKFGVNEKNEVYPKKTICFIHKVSLILVDKLLNYQWIEQGKKPSVAKFKVILEKDTLIPGQSDDDPEPYNPKSKKEKATASSVQSEA